MRFRHLLDFYLTPLTSALIYGGKLQHKKELASHSNLWSNIFRCLSVIGSSPIPLINYLMMGGLATSLPAYAESNIAIIDKLDNAIDQSHVISGINLITGQALNIATPILDGANNFQLQSPVNSAPILDQLVNPLVDQQANVINTVMGGYQLTEVLVPDLNSSIGSIINYPRIEQEIKERQRHTEPNNNDAKINNLTVSATVDGLLNTAERSTTEQGCQIVTAETPQLRFDARDSTQTLQLEVVCPKGVNYQIRPLHRRQFIDSTRIAYRNGEQLFPARMDMRHIDGRPLSQVKFEGNGEVQTLLIRASVVANPMPESGIIDTLGPLALMLIDLTKQP